VLHILCRYDSAFVDAVRVRARVLVDVAAASSSTGATAAQGLLQLSRTRLYGTLDRKKVSRLLAGH